MLKDRSTMFSVKVTKKEEDIIKYLEAKIRGTKEQKLINEKNGDAAFKMIITIK